MDFDPFKPEPFGLFFMSFDIVKICQPNWKASVRPQFQCMPEKLLQQLATERLPVTVTDPTKVTLVRTLREAGHVLALFLKVDRKRDHARVLAITPAGRKALADWMFKAMNAGKDPRIPG